MDDYDDKDYDGGEPVILRDNETGEAYVINAGGYKIYLDGTE